MISFDSTELEEAMADVARESLRSDAEIVTLNGQTLIKAIAYNTPKDSGASRGGWMPAWQAVELAGTPGTVYTDGDTFVEKRKRGSLTYKVGGRVDDKRTRVGNAELAWSNDTHVIDRNGRRFNYIWALNQRINFMAGAEAEATWKFRGIYERMLRKHSA